MRLRKNRFVLFSTVSLLVMLIGLTLSGCQDKSGEVQQQPEEKIDYEIALITDDSLIMDGGHSEVAWNTITNFGASKGISHKYYKATEATERASNEAIENAIANGAKIIVADGDDFQTSVFNLQKKYKDTKFVLVDGEAVDKKTGNVRITNNTVNLEYRSDQAGYMAGYAAVKDGYTKLGFIAESDYTSYVNFGYGYVLGANQAAKEQGIEVEMKFNVISGNYDSAKDIASKWYSEETQVIMVAGHDVERKVIEGAEANDGKVIATVSDASKLSDTVIVSAEENLREGISEALEAYWKDKFPGGESIAYSVDNDGVSLSMANSKFDNFDNGQYKDLLKALKDGELKVKVKKITSLDDLNLSNVNIK